MLITTDYVTPVELTGFARAALEDLEVNQFTLSTYLPSRTIGDLHYRFTRGGEGLTEAAMFRAYDAESPIGARPGLTRVTGELPPISRKIRLGEFDRLRLRQASNDAVVNAIYDDARRMARSVAARIELARGDALVNGTVTISENGVVATVDFGRAAAHTTAPGTLWSDTTNATVLSDLIVWRDLVVAATGVPPASILTSTAVLRLVQRNAEIINAVAGSAAGRTRVNLVELNTLLQSEGLPSFTVNDARVTVNGTATRVIHEDFIVMLPPTTGGDSELGATLWGTTAESLDASFDLTESDQPGVVAGSYSTQDPVAVWTKAAGISLPILANPDLTLAADVK